LEVFSVAGHESSDRCGCFEFEEIELASAVNLMLEAARATAVAAERPAGAADTFNLTLYPLN
jgi:hypothetical protein